MTCHNPCKSKMEVQELAELPIDNLASLPDFFLTERDVLDDTTGKVYHSITRTPANRLFPNGNMANAFTLDGNNPTIQPQSGQPIPVYIQNEGTSNVVYPANSTHKAQFFAIGLVGDLLLCQNTGVINTLEGNQYIVGAQYYLATNGGVTTDSTQTGQRLFVPLSQTKLLINL